VRSVLAPGPHQVEPAGGDVVDVHEDGSRPQPHEEEGQNHRGHEHAYENDHVGGDPGERRFGELGGILERARSAHAVLEPPSSAPRATAFEEAYETEGDPAREAEGKQLAAHVGDGFAERVDG
jgi:hypothetical protein